MKLFRISQDQNHAYDTYDCAVVAAPDEGTARKIHPKGGRGKWYKYKVGDWFTDPKFVDVEYLGEASPEIKQGVICASFNAG